MKKITYLLAGLTTMLICLNPVSAMTINSDGTMTNAKGAIITPEQKQTLLSRCNEQALEYFRQDEVDLFGDPNVNVIHESEFLITTYTLDRVGNILNVTTIPATEDQANAVAENDNLHVMPNGVLQDISQIPSVMSVISGNYYETESKEISANYAESNLGTFTAYVDATWKKTPKIKSYDVIAMRWGSPISETNNITYFTAYQRSDAGDVFYDQDEKYTRIKNDGVGVSMDLKDGASNYYLYLSIKSNKTLGNNIWATYQHAVSNISLDTSQSYYFGSAGLGGVLVYTDGYSKYYDNMTGLKLSK